MHRVQRRQKVGRHDSYPLSAHGICEPVSNKGNIRRPRVHRFKPAGQQHRLSIFIFGGYNVSFGVQSATTGSPMSSNEATSRRHKCGFLIPWMGAGRRQIPHRQRQRSQLPASTSWGQYRGVVFCAHALAEAWQPEFHRSRMAAETRGRRGTQPDTVAKLSRCWTQSSEKTFSHVSRNKVSSL